MREHSTNVFFPYFLAIAGFTAFAICATADRTENARTAEQEVEQALPAVTAPRPEEAVYRVGGAVIDLTAGKFEEPPIVTTVVGIPFRADLDRNGTEDAMVILRRDRGAEQLYYVAGALRRGDQYEGTDAYLLGDRIVLGRSTFENGLIVQEYLDHARGSSPDRPPTVPKTVLLKVVDGSVVDGRERGANEAD